MSNDDATFVEKLIGYILYGLVFVVLFVAALSYSVWILNCLYAWFWIPLGAPKLTFWQLYGVAMIPYFLLAPISIRLSNIGEDVSEGNSNKKKLKRIFGLLVGWPTFTLIIGFIVKSIM